MRFTVIGGDKRTVYLVHRLIDDGHEVHTFALDTADIPLHCQHSHLQEALHDTQYIILPTPAEKQGVLNAPFGSHEIPMKTLPLAFPKGVPVFGGGLSKAFCELCQQQSIPVTDLLSIEALAVKNADITAQCAVELILQQVPYSLKHRSVLILGAGRIGKLLGLKLRSMGAEVSVAARKEEDHAWCAALGFTPVHTEKLAPVLWRQDIVVNTIPARILDSTLLQLLSGDTLFVELASAPGGISPEDVALHDIHFVHGGGLPGKFAPQSAGIALVETIYQCIGGV